MTTNNSKHIITNYISSIQLGVLKRFAPWDIFWSEGIETF